MQEPSYRQPRNRLRGQRYCLYTEQGHRYMIWRSLSANQLYWRDTPMGERLPPLDVPLPDAWRARVGSRWACVNESPESLAKVLGPTVGRIDELMALPGYILWNNEQLLRVVDDRTAGMTIKVPGFSGRDLVELRMATVDGREEIHLGSQVFQQTATP